MATVPAYCNSCGSLFQSRLISLGSGASVQINNCTEACIRCGARARTLDGAFQAVGDALRILSAPSVTKDILTRFGLLIERTVSRDMTADQLEKEAGGLDPALGRAVAQLRASPWAIAFLAIMLAALKSCHFNVDAKVDVNRLLDQAVASSVESKPHNAKQNKQAANANATGDRAEVKTPPRTH